MITPLFISVMVFVLTFSLWLIFKRQYEKDVFEHHQRLALYNQELQIHKKQINKRSCFINKYDLSRYNISEVLIAQDEIKL